MKTAIIKAVIFLLAVGAFDWCICAAAGFADREAERIFGPERTGSDTERKGIQE